MARYHIEEDGVLRGEQHFAIYAEGSHPDGGHPWAAEWLNPHGGGTSTPSASDMACRRFGPRLDLTRSYSLRNASSPPGSTSVEMSHRPMPGAHIG